MIGTICMDQCMIDVSGVVGEVKLGDEVVLLGRQGEEEITIEELSQLICGFINYEYMVLLARRVPRVYRQGGKIVRVSITCWGLTGMGQGTVPCPTSTLKIGQLLTALVTEASA